MWTQILKTLAIKNNSRGFSIIEMVATMAIMTVLTGVSSVGYSKYKERARLVKARSTLGSSMQIAKAFKADRGYFLPNLEAMGIRFKGLLEYDYSVTCLRRSGSSYTAHGLCGEFTHADPSSSEECGSEDNQCTGNCWYGYIMAQSLRCNSDYTTDGFPFCHVMYQPKNARIKSSFPNLCQQARDAGTAINEEAEDKLEELFTARGSHEMCPDRVDDMSELRRTSPDASCARSKGYTGISSSSFAIILRETRTSGETAVRAKMDVTEVRSGPLQLVLIAYGCQDKQDDCRVRDSRSLGGHTFFNEHTEYQILTLNSQNNVYIERLNRRLDDR